MGSVRLVELNFDDDDKDIRLRDEPNRGGSTKLHKKILEFQSHISYRLRYSLRAYASVLYHRKFTNFNIILRGVPVEQYFIADEFLHKKVISYRPQLGGTAREVAVEATIGFVKEAPNINVSGFNVYHKNRLIRPFWKVTGDGSSKGNGVVGVLEANFIEPAHDKQDFERSSLYIRLETRLRQMIMDYWKDHCTLMGYQPPKSKAHQMSEGLSVSAGQDLYSQKIRNHEQETSAELGMPLPIYQICDENMRLFRRCEAYMKKDDELRKTIENLEKELQEINRKRFQLSLLLETKRKDKAIVLTRKI